jgi:hypothetical protein
MEIVAFLWFDLRRKEGLSGNAPQPMGALPSLTQQLVCDTLGGNATGVPDKLTALTRMRLLVAAVVPAVRAD